MGETAVRSRQRNVRVAAGLFAALLVALTLGGNTIRALMLPKVITSMPTTGTLDYAYEGSATVQPAAERELANPAGWPVLEVLVKAGDSVQQGQPLVRYDDGDARDQLADLQSSLKKMELSLDQLELNLKQALRDEDEAAKQSAANALEIAKLDIGDQKRRIGRLQQDIEAGSVLKAPVDGIVTAVGAEEGTASVGTPDIRLTDPSQGYRVRLTVPGQLAALLQVGDKPDSIVLADGDGDSEQAFAGTVAAIEETPGGSANLADQAGSFDVRAGGQADASNALLTISIQEEEPRLQGGERVKVRIRRSQGKGGPLLLVPNKAVHRDSRGAYVYTIRAKQGPLGNAYHAAETRIETAGSNDYATAVSSGLFEQEEIIVDSSGLIADGTRVRY